MQKWSARLFWLTIISLILGFLISWNYNMKVASAYFPENETVVDKAYIVDISHDKFHFGYILHSHLKRFLNRQLGYDMERLSYCIAMSETSNCTAGVGVSRNNCFGIKRNGSFVIYDSPEQSYADFRATWIRGYNMLPNLQVAWSWTRDGNEHTWLNNFNNCYYNG